MKIFMLIAIMDIDNSFFILTCYELSIVFTYIAIRIVSQHVMFGDVVLYYALP